MKKRGRGEGDFMRKPSRTWYGARTLATCGRRQGEGGTR
jgi:hypothetical protein